MRPTRMLRSYTSGDIPVDRFEPHALSGGGEVIRAWAFGTADACFNIASPFGITLLLDVEPYVTHRRGLNGHPLVSGMRPEGLLLLPGSVDMRYVLGGDSDVVSVAFTPAQLLALDLAPDRLMAARGEGTFDDPVIPGLIRTIHRRAQAGHRDVLFDDQAATFLLAAIASPEPREAPPRAGSSRRVRDAVALMEADLRTTPRLADLAAAAGLSVAQFCRCFRAETGLTPHGYLMRRRIEEARRILRGPRPPPLADLAATLGFSSHGHLTTVFRRLSGTTPAAWRRG